MRYRIGIVPELLRAGRGAGDMMDVPYPTGGSCTGCGWAGTAGRQKGIDRSA